MDYSISIGIEKYLELNGTKYAEADAVEFNRIMKENFDITDTDRGILLNEYATISQIQRMVEKTIEKMQEGDRLFFYFAGHGVSFYNEPRISCYDSMKDFQSNYMTWYNINDLIGKAESAKINAFVFIDACESTISYKRGEKKKVQESQYVIVFSAANSEEVSIATEEFGHGVWSHFLFAALNGGKEALENNKLTSTSLQNYLSLMVNDYYQKKYKECTQNPYMWGKMQDSAIIKDYTDFALRRNEFRVADVYFGIVDADNEYKKDKDSFVENFYDLNNAVQQIMEHNNIQYVFGKKGMGKTYIGRYLEETKSNNMRYLSFTKLNYKNFAFLAKSNPGYEPFMEIWQYVLLSYLVEFVGTEQKIEEIQKILKELFGFKVTLQQILNKRFKKGVKICNERAKGYFVKDNNVFELEEIVEMYKYILEEENREQHYVIIDGLDEKMNEHPKYKEIINALIWSVQELNDYFYENNILCKFILLMRGDVFDFVSGANINKIATGSSVTLKWVNESYEKSSYPLYEFVDKRLKNSTNREVELIDILPEHMQTKNGEIYNTWSWILNFTTYKPRDVVAFLSFCSVHCHKGETKLTSEILWDAVKDYSEYFYKELQDELYGFFTDEQIFFLFDVVFPKLGMRWVDYQELLGFINQKQLFEDSESEDIVERLYNVGVLGIRLDTGYEHWAYRSKAKLTEFLRNSKFKLHQGLWKKLSIW